MLLDYIIMKTVKFGFGCNAFHIKLTYFKSKFLLYNVLFENPAMLLSYILFCLKHHYVVSINPISQTQERLSYDRVSISIWSSKHL